MPNETHTSDLTLEFIEHGENFYRISQQLQAWKDAIVNNQIDLPVRLYDEAEPEIVGAELEVEPMVQRIRSIILSQGIDPRNVYLASVGPIDELKSVEEPQVMVSFSINFGGMRYATTPVDPEVVVHKLIRDNTDKWEQAKTKPSLLNWFVGKAIQESKGKLHPGAVKPILNRLAGVVVDDNSSEDN